MNGEVLVFIVGGGPAGSLSAINLGKADFEVGAADIGILLVEEHQSAGFPVQCGGLISEDCLESLLKYVSGKFVINKIEGAFVFSPSGNFFEMKGKSKAVVINRKILDTKLIAKASKYAEVLVKTKVVDISYNAYKLYKVKLISSVSSSSSSVSSVSVSKKVKADYVVGADGCSSIVAKSLNFERPEFFSAAQIECEFESLENNMVELYFGERYSDCMFAYSIPLGDGISRIGVVCRENALERLKYLIEKHPSVSKRIEKNKNLEFNCGAIPFKLVDFVKDRAILIGDSAGMVKPYTGGGIYYLLKAAELLGSNFPDLQSFKREYFKTLGKEYSAGMKIAKLYSMLSDEDYEFIVKVGKDYEYVFPKLHMDKPSTLINVVPLLLKFLRKPSISLKVARCLLSGDY